MKKYVESYAREGTRDGADEASREWVRQMGQITPLLTPDLQCVCVWLALLSIITDSITLQRPE